MVLSAMGSSYTESLRVSNMIQSKQIEMIQQSGTLRRSSRLMENGYYHPDDPNFRLISYKETPFRIFKKRKKKPQMDRVYHDSVHDFSMGHLENLESGTLRRSSRLMENGYYHPDDPNFRLISYKETPVRIFKKRKGKKKPKMDKVCHNVIDDYSMSDLEIPESDEEVYDEEVYDPPHHPSSLFTRCSTVQWKRILLAFFLLLLGFGAFFGYLCVTKYVSRLGEHSVKHTDIQDHTTLLKEIESLKQTVKDYRIEFKEMLHSALSLHRADDIGMADYALESLGTTVVSSSETYKTTYCSLFGLKFWCKQHGPETVLQPDVFPGNCWAFKGSKGFLLISLIQPIRISHVSLQHIPRAISPGQQISSAPKDFEVYGLESMYNKKHFLGVFMYDQDGEPIQTFKLPDCPSQLFQLVELRILSNWGHPEYTCVYRFRIHSQPSCM